MISMLNSIRARCETGVPASDVEQAAGAGHGGQSKAGAGC